MTRSGRRTHRGQKPRICTPLHSRFVVSVLIALLLTGDFSGILQVEAQRNNQLRSTRASFSPRQPNVVPGGTTTFVEPPDESSGAYPSYPLNHTLDAYPQVLSNGPANWDFEAAAYEVGSRPGNSDFETAPSTVDTPTNWDFSAGSLTGWTVSGTVNASAGGPDGYYAAFSNSGTNTLTSSAFTVSAGADFLQYVISNGSLTVTVLYGGSYASRTSLGTKTCTSPCSWKLFSSNISTWSGQSIKLEFKRGAGGGSPYLDRVRTVTYGSGWLVGGDADFQSYGGSTWLGGSQAVTTPAITIDANAQYLTFQALKTTSGTVQRQVYIRSGAGYATETAIGGFYVSGPDVVNTYRVPIYPWAGQSIKLVIGEFASGYVYLDNIGVQMVVAPDWTFADPVYSRMLSNELTNGAVEQDGALAVDGSDPGNVLSLKGDDDVISSPYAIPSGAQSLLLQVRKGYFGTGHTATNLTVKILSGAGYATVTNLMPTGPRSISVDDWEYLVLPINAFAGQTVKLRLEANYIVLLNDVGFTGSVVPGWQVLGDSDAVTVRYDAISGTYLQAQDTTKKFSVSSSMTSIGILPGGSATDGRSISIGYSFGADSLSQVKIYWVAVMNGIDQTPVLITTKTAASASDTDYKDDRFEIKRSDLPTDGDDLVQTGYYKISGTKGARLYQIADNLARQQQAEPFRHTAGNGIDIATGNFSWQETDMVLDGGPLPIVFSRYYTAHSDRLGPLGYRWRHSYDIQLYINSGATLVSVLFGDGHEEPFELTSGVYVPLDPRIDATLAYDAGTTSYTYTSLSKMQFHFMGSGLLFEVEDPTGNTLELAYDGSDRLESVTTYGGRSIELSYDASDRLSQLTGPSGEVVDYTYSDVGDLVSVATNDGQQTDYTYSRHRMRTASVMDSSGPGKPSEMKQVVANKLDDYNRVTRQTDATDIDIQIHYQQDFATPTPAAEIGVTFVKDRSAAGAVTQYHFDHFGRSTYVVTPELVVTQFAYDDVGNLTSWVDGSGGQYQFSYDPLNPNRINGITDPLNNSRSIEVDAQHKPTITEDAYGIITTYDYDGQTRMTEKIVDPGNLNLKTIFTYYDGDSEQMETMVVDPDGLALTTKLEYNGDGLVSRKILDPGGLDLTWEYGYDESGHLLVEVDPSGLRKRYTYTGFGRIETTIVDPEKKADGSYYDVGLGIDHLNLVSRYVFDFGGKLTATMDPNCIENFIDYQDCQSEWYYNESGLVTDKYDTMDVRTHYEYNELGLMTETVQDATLDDDSPGIEKNFLTLYEYDDDGRLTDVIVDPDGLNLVTHYTYDEAGRLEYEYLDYGESPHYNLTTQYIYDEKGRLTGKRTPGMVEPEGWSYEYDNNDRLVLTTDPEGRESENVYDRAGRLWKTIIDPNGQALTTTYTYDKANRLTDTENAAGLVTHTDYDDASRPIATIVDPGGEAITTQTVYNPNGSVWKTIDPEGRITERQYDRAGRLWKVIAPGGATTTYWYDLNSQLIRTTDPDGVVTEMTYDLMGRQTDTVLDPLGENIHTETVYDRLGRPTETINPRGYSTTTTYDTAGRVWTITDATSAVLTYGYDSASRLTDVTDPLGSVTHTTYDAYSNADLVTYAYGTMKARTWNRDYDLTGAVIRVQDPNGNDLRYWYDTVCRLDAITDPSEDPYVNYTYDGVGRTQSIVNANGTISYAYNDLGQVETVTQNGQSIGYTYTDAGQRDTMTLPGSRVVDYAYDAATGQLETITDFSNQPGPTEYSWKPSGRLDKITRPTDALDDDLDILSQYGYDTAGRLDAISHSQDGIFLAEYGYTLDKNGNREEVDFTGTEVVNGTETYVYNELDQLTSATYVDTGTAIFTYDANGNRKTVKSGAVTTTYNYDVLGQLDGITSDDPLVDPLVIEYDNNGNRKRVLDGATTLREYTWDWSNRLTSVDVGGIDTDYTYLGDDTRLSQTTSAGTTDYLVERQSGLPQVVDDGESAYLHDVTGNSMAIDGTSSGATYPLSDALGSTRLTLDGTGTPLGSTDWDAWGNERYSDGTSYEFGYTGQQYDESADLYFNRARYYSPGTAQFLSRDTLQPNAGGATGYNAYQYANDNPSTFSDPSGHFVSYEASGLGPFGYMAYIFECFLAGSCRYQNEHHPISYEQDSASQPDCSASKVRGKAILFSGVNPRLVASGCSGAASRGGGGDSNSLSDTNCTIGVDCGSNGWNDLTVIPVNLCTGNSSQGYGWIGAGPWGAYVRGDTGKSRDFDMTFISYCMGAAINGKQRENLKNRDEIASAVLEVLGEVCKAAPNPWVCRGVFIADMEYRIGKWLLGDYANPSNSLAVALDLPTAETGFVLYHEVNSDTSPFGDANTYDTYTQQVFSQPESGVNPCFLNTFKTPMSDSYLFGENTCTLYWIGTGYTI